MSHKYIREISGIPISSINKEFDNTLYNIACNIRKDVAKTLSIKDNYWEDYKIDNDMLSSVLERTPFCETERVLKFNIAVTEESCEVVLKSQFAVLEKIGIYSFVVELGAREFFSPDDTGIVFKNLSAAKERGYFFTPPSLAIRMVLASLENAASARSVLDPACGVGVFLAYHIALNSEIEQVYGIEIDERTVEHSNRLLRFVSASMRKNVEINLICSDFFVFFERRKHDINADIIIMNPPYGAVKFLASDLTDSSTIAVMSKEEKAELENRLKQTTIEKASRLRIQFSRYGMDKGTLEFSKLFVVAALEMKTPDGVVVSITPSSWLGDESSIELRKAVFLNGLMRELWIIPEKAKLFKGVNQPTSVSVFAHNESGSVLVINPVLRVEDIDSEYSDISFDNVLAISGDRLKFPQCSEELLLILRRLRQIGGDIKSDTTIVNMRGELDLTAHKAYVSERDTGHRLVRGDHIQNSILVSALDSEKAGYVQYDDFCKLLVSSEKAKYIQRKRIAIAQCSYLQKKKRIEAAIVPAETILGNSCNFIAISESGNCDDIQLFYYWMILNSSVIEWQFRVFSYNNHVSNKEIDEFLSIPYEELSQTRKNDIVRLYSDYKPGDGFSLKHDAYIASLFELSGSEYRQILEFIGYDMVDEYLSHYNKESSVGNSIPQHQMPSLSELDKLMISYVEPGGNWTSIPETVPSKRLDQIREMARTRGMVRTTYYSRLQYHQPAYTISTYFNRPGNGANIHPWEDRTLSSREAARLQSFPDRFIFEGTESEIRTQIGNAVPPLLGYAIGVAIKKKIGHSLQFCDIFAGAGGLSYGMELAGYTGVAAVEIDKSAARTFARNHSSSIRTIVGDINDPQIQSDLYESINERIESSSPWVLVGGPPCQGFSTAGYRDENDIRNKLVDSYLTIINTTRPTIVVMENVPGILSMKNGDVIKGVFQSLHNLGYVFDQTPWILDAEQYGVPQMRKRVIIVAAREKQFLPDYPEPLFERCLGRREQIDKQMTLLSLSYPVTVGEAFLGLPPLMNVNAFYPKNVAIDQTYSNWCEGKITVEELLNSRSGKQG